MGIKNLNKFITKYSPSSITEIDTNILKNTVIAIDAYNILYQFLTAIRASGKDFKTENGKITTHIYAILMKTISFLKKGITPIYVFDGKAPEIKNNTLEHRYKIKKIAQDELDKIEAIETLTNNDIDKKKKLMQQTTTLTLSQVDECKQILKLFGLPYVEAPSEADPQLAYLIKENLVDYVISEDMDLLTFGCKKLIRNYGTKKSIKLIELDKILADTNLTMNQFIDLCIMMGCDYSDTLNGIGMTRAYDLLKKYKKIELILENIDENKISDNFNYKMARNTFLNSPIKKINKKDLMITKSNVDKLLEVIIDEYEFDDDYWNKMLSFLAPSKQYINTKYKFSDI
jgi:flap endonuclease-1